MQVIDVRKAAEEAGVFASYVYRAIWLGVLKARKQDGKLQISRKSFELWKQRLADRRRIREEEKLLSAKSD